MKNRRLIGKFNALYNEKMNSKSRKKWSVSFVIREIQISNNYVHSIHYMEKYWKVAYKSVHLID